MTVLFAQNASALECERADGAALPAFASIPDMVVVTTSAGTWALMFSGMFLIPKPGAVELRFLANGVPVAGSERVMDVSAGGLMNDRCLTLEATAAPGSGLEIRCQWRAVKGKIKLTDRRLTAFL